MSGPFATYFGDQRVVAIPSSPQASEQGQVVAGGTTTLATVLVLGTNNITNNTVYSFIHYFYAQANPFAAAGAALHSLALQWQFRTAGHVNVGAPVAGPIFFTGQTGGAAAGVYRDVSFCPRTPHTQLLAVPATAAEVVLQIAGAAVGAPNSQFTIGFGIDPTNGGPVGDIGGGGIVAQSANNPNAF